MSYKNIEDRREYHRKWRQRNRKKWGEYAKKCRNKHMDKYHPQRLGKNINLYETSDVETVFKVEPPLTEVSPKIGYGYMGVILRDKIEDKLQCHICGRWFKSLTSHLRTHKIKSREYKIRFSLPLTYPLVSRSISEKFSNNVDYCFKGVDRKKAIRKAIKNSLIRRFENKRKYSKIMRYSSTNMAFQNIRGICNEQILRRFMIVSDIIGGEPKTGDLVKYDNNLLAVIMRRYGNLNNFRKHHNFTVSKTPNRYTDEQLISIVRRFKIETGRRPKESDFVGKIPSVHAFKNHFGSWNRLLTLSGY